MAILAKTRYTNPFLVFCTLGILSYLLSPTAFAAPILLAENGPPPQDPPPKNTNTPPPSDSKAAASDRTLRSEEDDFSGSPFTEYGEFNDPNEEESETQFLQHGRLFGVSLGVGFQFTDGNRALLWQGGLPLVDFKLHYWFDFNLALDIGVFSVYHYYNTAVLGQGRVDVNIIHAGLDLRYYFNTKNLSSSVTFASPFILVGGGAFNKIENVPIVGSTPSNYTSLGVTAGAGVEFTLSPKKSYLQLEGKLHVVTFQDSGTTQYASQGIPNLTGNFWTISSNILLTW